MGKTEYERIRRRRESRPFKLLTEVLPLPALRVLRYESRLTWLRVSRPRVDRRFLASSQLLVNVGCGPRGRDGWVNVDSFPAEGVTCVHDCRTSLPLPDHSARGVFTEHFLEHLDYYEQIPLFLAECLRVLEPGGILRVIVPDGEKYLRGYVADGWDELRSFSPLVTWDPSADDRPMSSLGEILPFTTKMEVVNYHFRQAGQHQFSYDYETLAKTLEKAGFQEVCRRGFRESSMPELAIDREFRAPESLVVEGRASS